MHGGGWSKAYQWCAARSSGAEGCKTGKDMRSNRPYHKPKTLQTVQKQTNDVNISRGPATHQQPATSAYNGAAASGRGGGGWMGGEGATYSMPTTCITVQGPSVESEGV